VNWFRSRDYRRRELEDELRSHLAMAARERMSRGERPREAEWAAKREFGNFPKVSEEVQDAWRSEHRDRIDRRMRDISGLGVSPSLAIMVAVAFALGIGARGEVSSLIANRRQDTIPGATAGVHDYQIVNVARTRTAPSSKGSESVVIHDQVTSKAPASVWWPADSVTLVPGAAMVRRASVAPTHVWTTVQNISRQPQPR
jgi:hypothetical protein